MPGGSWKGTQWKGKWVEPWQRKGQEKSSQDEDLLPKLILKERNPWLTPTENCASDETEEEMEAMVAQPGLSDPVGEVVRETRLETQPSGMPENHIAEHEKRQTEESDAALLCELIEERQKDEQRGGLSPHDRAPRSRVTP